MTVASMSNHLIAKRLRAPGRLVAAFGDEVFGAPGDAERSPITTRGNLLIRAASLFERQFLGESDDAVQPRVVALQSFEVELGELPASSPGATRRARRDGSQARRRSLRGRSAETPREAELLAKDRGLTGDVPGTTGLK